MNSLRKLGVTGLLVAVFVGVVGCGGDDSGSNSSAKLESCKQVCDKQKSCPINFGDDCKKICDAFAQGSSACQDALKAVSDCQLKQADICAATGCDAEETAFDNACK